MHSALRASIQRGFRLGMAAGRENRLPALFLQLLMGLMVLGYYLQWPTTRILTLLAHGQAIGGLGFAFVASGTTYGIASELCKVYFIQGGRWQSANRNDLLFKFLLFGLLGISCALLYIGLSRLLGSVVTWRVIIAKVCIDQFVYSAFFSCPTTAIATHWKNQRYRLSSLRDVPTASFISLNIIPLVMTCWSFWIPITTLIYALPLPLQLPLALLAGTIWSLLALSVSTQPSSTPTPIEEALS